MHLPLARFLLVLPVCWPLSLPAADMTVSGQLRLPLCEIHNGNHAPLTVSFGDSLNIARLGTGEYERAISYVVECEDQPAGLPFELEIDGVASAWSNAVLSARPGMGVRLKFDGHPVTLGRPELTTRADLPVLTAEPVADPQASPEEGPFSASASFRARYY